MINEQLMREQIMMLSDAPKRVDSFEVTFYNLPEEVAGFLGKQVKQINRPGMTFQESTTRDRRSMHYHKMQHTFVPISATFFDDENSIVSMILYSQIMRQMNHHYDIFGKQDPGHEERDYKFDIKVDVKNSRGDVTESYILRECFIMEIQHSDAIVVDESENEITIGIAYNNVDVKIFDQMLAIIDYIEDQKNAP